MVQLKLHLQISCMLLPLQLNPLHNPMVLLHKILQQYLQELLQGDVPGVRGEGKDLKLHHSLPHRKHHLNHHMVTEHPRHVPLQNLSGHLLQVIQD